MSTILRRVLVFAVLAAAVFVLWIGFLKPKFFPASVEQSENSQSVTERQKMELARLRAEAGWQLLSAEQIKEQEEQLENLRRKNNSAVLSEQEIKNQLEDLNKLRSGQ